MFRTIFRFLASVPDLRRKPARSDTDHLRSSRANQARLDAAIAELDAGRGTLATMAGLQGPLRDAASR
jgi:hypothetical protein